MNDIDVIDRIGELVFGLLLGQIQPSDIKSQADLCEVAKTLKVALSVTGIDWSAEIEAATKDTISNVLRAVEAERLKYLN